MSTVQVGEGIRARMAEVGDEPISHEWTEQRGPSRQACAWGRQGLYVASDDGGEWVTAGPFGAAEG